MTVVSQIFIEVNYNDFSLLLAVIVTTKKLPDTKKLIFTTINNSYTQVGSSRVIDERTV